MVAAKVSGFCRGAVFFQIRRGRDGDDTGFKELAGDEAGGRGRIDEADGEIEAFARQVAKFGGGEEFEGDLWVAVEEAAKVRGEEKV
jgi:hypothetical protein